jgi:hypothetical protein
MCIYLCIFVDNDTALLHNSFVLEENVMEPKKINGTFCSMMPCCGIFAGALISGYEPQEVFDAYKAVYKKTGGWKGSTNRKALVDLIQSEFGVKLKQLDGLDYMTVRNFHFKYAKPSATYLVYVTGHVMVINKGRLIDQWHCEPVETAKKNRCKVATVYEVTSDVNIPEGKVSGIETKEDQAAAQQAEQEAKLQLDKDRLWKGACKYGLDTKATASYKGQKMRLIGYNPKKKRYPFVLEVFEKNGKPCKEIGETSVFSAQSWFGISNTQKAA